jgi:hypothetical protein
VRQHSDQAVIGEFIEDCVLQVELDLLVDICIVERGSLRIVTQLIGFLTFYLIPRGSHP